MLRTVDKCGGLDEYLLGEKAQRIKELGMGGWKLRWRIMQTEKVKERFRRQREFLGLDPLPDTTLALANEEDVARTIEAYDAELQKGADIEIGDEADGEIIDEEAVESGFMEEQPPKDQKIVL